MQKLEFKTPFGEKSTIFTEAGSKTRPKYKAVLNKNGMVDLVEDGVDDVWSYIQSFKDSVDINVIIERYAHGDTSALMQSEGFYGDFVEVPKSYMEALNAAIDLRNAYESNNIGEQGISFDDFVSSVLNPIPNDNTVVNEEVIDNEPKSE